LSPAIGGCGDAPDNGGSTFSMNFGGWNPVGVANSYNGGYATSSIWFQNVINAYVYPQIVDGCFTGTWTVNVFSGCVYMSGYPVWSWQEYVPVDLVGSSACNPTGTGSGTIHGSLFTITISTP
jgi:hypothetical protein